MAANAIRILYMEDDLGLARLFEKKMTRAGYHVDLASDGAQGLSMYDPDKYDVVAVDQNMPAYDGLQVIRLLAKEGPLPPTIMITGTGNEQIAIEAMKLGAGDYIVKDAHGGYLDLLPSVIEQLLHRQRLIREKREASEALQQLSHHLALLNLVGQRMAATLDLQQVMRLLLESATETINAEGAAVWLRDDNYADELVCRAKFWQHVYEEPENIQLTIPEGIVGWVVQNSQSVILADVTSDERLAKEMDNRLDFNTVSMLAVPLRARDSVIGVLEIVNKIDSHFTAYDQGLVETLATSAAISIDNAQLVEQLQQQTLELKARNEELDAFSHTVAHDLKSPLNPIISMSQALDKYYDTMTDEEVLTYLRSIAQSGQKMISIIDELLLLSRMHNVAVEMEPLAMGFIVDDALHRLGYMLEESGAEVIQPDEWPVAMGYAPWIEEVWVNYLSNAIKYGGNPPHIELGCDPHPHQMTRFWIRDNGGGLTVEEQAKLFVPFTKLSQIRVEGHGLGLSIVRRIIERLGGEVGVQSDGIAGRGSLFYFTLPQLPPEALA